MSEVIWANYETPFVLPDSVDFATFSNEDNGFIANLVTATNDTYEFASPYPSSVDLFEETIVWYKSDQMYNHDLNELDNAEIMEQINIENSMLQIEHGLTYRGSLVDLEDESHKSKFAGQFTIGATQQNMGTAASVAASPFRLAQQSVMQYSPVRRGIDLITPRYEVYINGSFSVAETTGATAPGTFSKFERVSERIWHRKRRLSSDERSFRMISTRFQIIDT